MIINLVKFIEKETPFWKELEVKIDKLERFPNSKESLDEVKQIYYLYKRSCTDLIKIRNDANDPSLEQYLESMVARAYRIIYDTAPRSIRFKPFYWFFITFPRTLRKHCLAFLLSFLMVFAGAIVGTYVLHVDNNSRKDLLPQHLHISPEERVEKEENVSTDRLGGKKMTFSSYLMTHNIRVSIFTFSLGITFGIGTVFLLFTNGIMIGAISYDYIVNGQLTFLLGWLLPHGSTEIPSILIAGQAGFVLAAAIIGKKSIHPLKKRLKDVSSDIITLIGGCSVLLIWSGIIESFFSQYHAPIIPYSVKIIFGVAELALLITFLTFSGREKKLKLNRISK